MSLVSPPCHDVARNRGGLKKEVACLVPVSVKEEDDGGGKNSRGRTTAKRARDPEGKQKEVGGARLLFTTVLFFFFLSWGFCTVGISSRRESRRRKQKEVGGSQQYFPFLFLIFLYRSGFKQAREPEEEGQRGPSAHDCSHDSTLIVLSVFCRTVIGTW